MANTTVYPFGTGGSLPSSVGIVNDPFTGGADKAFSAEQGKTLNESLNSLSEIDLSSLTEYGAFITDGDKWAIDYQNYKGKFLHVNPGEKYVIKGNETNSSLCAILKDSTRSSNSSVLYANGQGRFVVGKNEFCSVVIPADGFVLYFSTYSTMDLTPSSIVLIESRYTKREADELIQLEIDLADYPAISAYPTKEGTWIKNNSKYPYYGVFIPCKGGDRFNVTSIATSGVYYSFLKSNNTSASADWADGYSGIAPPWTRIGFSTINAPSDAKYLYLVASWDGMTSSVLPSSIYKVSNVYSATPSIEVNTFPTVLKIGESQKVLYTRDNVLIKYGTENDVDYIYFSDDLGETWTTLENTFGDITHIHLFATGTVLFCTRQAAYYTKDFVNVNQATVYDYDGSTTVPSGTRFYSIPKPHKERTYIDGNEWHMFWDYVIVTRQPRCWYSNDDGKTVRCAFAFGAQTLNGATVPARHVHDFQYNKYDGKFYCFTGDSVSECHVLRGTLSDGNISWEKLKTGGEYKLVSIDFDEGNFYAVTDYTESSLADKKGIIRCPIGSIDFDNFNYLFHATSTMMGNAALDCYFCDKNGWRVCGTDYRGGPKTLIAKNNWNLVWVDNSKQYRFWTMMGPNDNGDIYCHLSSTGIGGGSVSGEDWLKLNMKSFNLTEAMRNSGAKDFCDYKISKY